MQGKGLTVKEVLEKFPVAIRVLCLNRRISEYSSTKMTEAYLEVAEDERRRVGYGATYQYRAESVRWSVSKGRTQRCTVAPNGLVRLSIVDDNVGGSLSARSIEVDRVGREVVVRE